MSKFVETLSDYIKQELSNAIGNELGSSLRVIFSGPPSDSLTALFHKLTGGNLPLDIRTSKGLIQIPVYLLDQSAQDPQVVPQAARCTDSYFVGKIRNNGSIGICLALHDCVSTTLSVDSTVTRLGIPHEPKDLGAWMNSPLVHMLLNTALEAILGPEGVRQAWPAVTYALQEAWEVDERNRDKRTTWGVLKDILDFNVGDLEPHLAFSLALGFPSCDARELGLKDQLETLNRLSDYLESHGLRSGMASIEENAGEELAPHVRAFRKHLDDQNLIDTSELSRSPLQVYCPSDRSPGAIPDWWRSLTVDVWSRLLDVGTDSTPSGKLEVTPLDMLAPSVKGMPHLMRDNVKFAIAAHDIEHSISVMVSRGIGSARFQEMGQLIIEPGSPVEFIDENVPRHERFLRYKVEAEGVPAVTMRFIVVNEYGPGVVALVRGSIKTKPFSLNKKAKDDQNRRIERYECDLQLSGMGSHQLDLYVSKSTELPSVINGYEVDAEHSVLEQPINSVDENHAVCLIDTDEECHYEFNAKIDGSSNDRPFRIYVTADDVEATGASSEFDRLVIAHRAAARREQSIARVDPVSCRAANLEEWILEDNESYHPMVLGPDYLDSWRKPVWSDQIPISAKALLIDPRPAASDFVAPQEYTDARARVFKFLRGDPEELPPTAATIKYWELMRDDDFVTALGDLLNAYGGWLISDYNIAIWTDVVAVHGVQANADALESAPYAILQTPFNPVRLAWQCRAQEMLQQALEKEKKRCPAASTLNPSAFPDCLILPCRTATGSIDLRPFVSMTTTSDYWSVLWSTSAIERLGETERRNEVFGSSLGISVDGLASGFSSQQVVRALDEVSRLASARSTLRVGISSDNAGSGSCNEGIDSWCVSNLGREQDYWDAGGPRSLHVTDFRADHLHPEQSVIASLTSRTDASVKWFKGNYDETLDKHDLSVIEHLGTMSHDFAKEGIRSAVDPSGLTRWRIRKQLPNQNSAFIAESRIGEIPTSTDLESIAGQLLACVDTIERQCHEHFDCYVFAPNMTSLGSLVDKSWYTAVSSSNIDAACFFGTTEKAYMWDYELPAYSRRAGENSGYFLLAKESPGMLFAVRNALNLLGDPTSVTDESISSMLEEISHRGMPTLKRLTAGGSMSLGEIGMLVALRLLQSEFESDREYSGIVPVMDRGRTLNLVVPVDPFKNQFEDLRVAIDNRPGERPDLLVLSIGFESTSPRHLKITPIEVKARGGVLSAKKRTSALDQARLFGDFLDRIKDQASGSELWAIAWRSLVATLLDYGFRVYGQLDQFMQQSEWAAQHSSTLRALTNGDLEIEIDTRGRVIVIDDTNSSAPTDTDKDSFKETIVLNHNDAFSLLVADGDEIMKGVQAQLGDWELKPSDQRTTSPLTSIEPPEPDSATESTIGEIEHAPDLSIPDSHNAMKTKEVSESDDQEIARQTPQLTPAQPTQNTEEAATANGNTEPTHKGIRFPIGRTIQEFTEQEVEFFPGNTALNQLNIGVVGDLGTGKTQLIQSLIYQMQANPDMNRGIRPNILIFDYKRDYTKPEFVKATGATVIQPFDIPLNLFDIRDSEHQRNAWLGRYKFFTDVLGKIYSGIGPSQREKIKRAVKSSYDAAKGKETKSPTINDVFDAYRQENDGAPDSPYSIMSDLVDGEYFVSDASKVIPFSEFLNGVVVLDLSSVGQDDRTKNMLVVIFLNLFYEHMLRTEKRPYIGADPQLRAVDSMLLVDEADNIMQYEFDVLKKILLQGREFGVGVLLASQYLSHFKTSHENYLEPLLTWFVHKVPNITTKDLEGIGLSGVNAEKAAAIKSLECHECLAKTLGVDGKIIRGTPFFELQRPGN